MNSMAINIFDTVADQDSLGLYSDGTLNVRKLAGVVTLSQKVLEGSARQNSKIPDLVREVLEQIAATALFVAEAFGGNIDKTARWFRTPNPLLGFATPRDMIRHGQHRKLQYLVAVSAGLGREAQPSAAKITSRPSV